MLRQFLQHYFKPSFVLIYSISILAAIGTLMVFSSSAAFSILHYGTSERIIIKHIIFLVLGFFIAFFVSRVDYKIYEKYKIAIMFCIFFLLVLVLIPGIGSKHYGARRWIRFFGFGIQPTELFKIAFVIWYADFFKRKKDKINSLLEGIAPAFIFLILFLLLIVLQPDFGTSVLLAMTLLISSFILGAKKRHILLILGILSFMATILVLIFPYRMKRIIAFLDPFQYPDTIGYQLVNSIRAFGSGGIFGRGLGNSLQKFHSLPQAHTDFIFAIIGEENGLIGICFILFIYLILTFAGLSIAKNAQEEFGRNLAILITVLITLQALFHMFVVLGLSPTKGIGLPFISYGGSSLLTFLTLIGILYNISKNQHQSPSLTHES